MKISLTRPSRKDRQVAKKRGLADWHEKFAWLPTAVDETEKTHSIVWLEKYMRRLDRRPTNSPYYWEKPKKEKPRWETLSTKNYFKKKLNGDFDMVLKGETDRVMTQIQAQAATSAPAKTNISRMEIKADGNAVWQWEWFEEDPRK